MSFRSLILIACFAFAGLFRASAQQRIPEDPETVVGKLDNGMTYYVRHNANPKGCADFYIYYKVRAVDYATNEGAYTAPLQVIRPSMIQPAVPHIDSVWVDQVKGVRMRWICSNEQQISHHVLMRKLANAKKWTVIGVYNGDSLRATGNVVDVMDAPEYVRRNRYESTSWLLWA